MIPELHLACDCANGFTLLTLKLCPKCDGLAFVNRPGGPRFGAPFVLGERAPGEIVELATGQRARIAWHTPRGPKPAPETTHVAILDPWDDSESDERIAYPSATGVRGVFGPRRAIVEDDGARAKGADELDPFTRRAVAEALL